MQGPTRGRALAAKRRSTTHSRAARRLRTCTPTRWALALRARAHTRTCPLAARLQISVHRCTCAHAHTPTRTRKAPTHTRRSARAGTARPSCCLGPRSTTARRWTCGPRAACSQSCCCAGGLTHACVHACVHPAADQRAAQCGAPVVLQAPSWGSKRRAWSPAASHCCRCCCCWARTSHHHLAAASLPPLLPPPPLPRARRVWFQGATDMEQLSLVFAALGAPDEASWPGVSQLKTFVPFKRKVRARGSGRGRGKGRGAWGAAVCGPCRPRPPAAPKHAVRLCPPAGRAAAGERL